MDDGTMNIHACMSSLRLQVIVKWGGVLTHLGRRQAEELGNIYRMVMYPNSSDGGLLRLHSTYRHDLKIYSSDEGRVQTSAAAFAKGLLDLEGDSLVRTQYQSTILALIVEHCEIVAGYLQFRQVYLPDNTGTKIQGAYK